MDKKRKWFIFISILLTIVSIALGLTIFFAAYKRLWETLGDLAVSVKFYFFEILQIEHTVNPSVTKPSDVLESTPMLPETPDLFRLRTSIFFKLFSAAPLIRPTWDTWWRQSGCQNCCAWIGCC